MLADLVNNTTVEYDDYKGSLMLTTGFTWQAELSKFLGSKMPQRWRAMKVGDVFATLKRCVLRSSPAITDDAGIVQHTPIVMDSGATRYYVLQNLVKPDQWRDNKVKVALGDKSRVICRTARVNIRFGDRDETRTAIVLPPNSDVLYPTTLMSEQDIQLVKKYGN